jgi:hypothetical protein
MRINKHLVTSSPKRKPEDLERELTALKKKRNVRFWDDYVKNTFDSMRHPEPCGPFTAVPLFHNWGIVMFKDLFNFK